MGDLVFTQEQFQQLLDALGYFSFVGVLMALFVYDFLCAGFKVVVARIDKAIERKQIRKYGNDSGDSKSSG